MIALRGLIRFKNSKNAKISDIYCTKRLTSLTFNFSHLNKHRFKHTFNDMIIPCPTGVLILQQLFITSCVADLIQFNEWNSLTLCVLCSRSCQFDAKSISQKPVNIFPQNFSHMFTSLLGTY